MQIINVRSVMFVTFFSILFINAGVGTVLNSLLYFIQPKHFSVGKYEVYAKFPNWVYLGDDSLFIHMSGKDGIMNAEILKRPLIDTHFINDAYSQCYEMVKTTKTYKNLQGEMFTCKKPVRYMLYFQSNNKDFFMQSELKEEFTKKMEKEYDLLLNGVKKRKN